KNKEYADNVLKARRLGNTATVVKEAIDDFVKDRTKEYYLGIDGVIANFVDRFLEYLNLSKVDVLHYNDARIILNYYRVVDDLDFWESIMPYNFIPGIGVEIPFPVKAYLTPRPEHLIDCTMDWMERFGIQTAPIISCPIEEKGDYIPRGAFVLDDNPN